MLTRRKYHL